MGLPGVARGQWHWQCCCGHLIICHHLQASLSPWSYLHAQTSGACFLAVAFQISNCDHAAICFVHMRASTLRRQAANFEMFLY